MLPARKSVNGILAKTKAEELFSMIAATVGTSVDLRNPQFG